VLGLVVVTVTFSVLLHGLTAGPLAARYGAFAAGLVAHRPEKGETAPFRTRPGLEFRTAGESVAPSDPEDAPGDDSCPPVGPPDRQAGSGRPGSAGGQDRRSGRQIMRPSRHVRHAGATQTPVEGRVEGEDPAVRRHQPVAGSARGGEHPDDRLREGDIAGGSWNDASP